MANRVLTVLQEFEGLVEEVYAEEKSFVARLVDLTDRTRPDELAEFPFDKIPEEERKHINVGRYFHLEIGHYQTSKAPVSLIKFYDEKWTEEDIKRARKNAEEWAKFWCQ